MIASYSSCPAVSHTISLTSVSSTLHKGNQRKRAIHTSTCNPHRVRIYMQKMIKPHFALRSGTRDTLYNVVAWMHRVHIHVAAWEYISGFISKQWDLWPILSAHTVAMKRLWTSGIMYHTFTICNPFTNKLTIYSALSIPYTVPHLTHNFETDYYSVL